MKKLTILILTLLILASCASVQPEIDDTLNPVELFQLAQESSNKKDYETALRYYEAFISNHSDDIQRLIEAEYEIAFITFKQGNLSRAEELFTDLLDRYTGDGSQVLPAWPMVLSKKLLKQIESESL